MSAGVRRKRPYNPYRTKNCMHFFDLKSPLVMSVITFRFLVLPQKVLDLFLCILYILHIDVQIPAQGKSGFGV